MQKFWGDRGDGDGGDPPETEVIGLNSSQRGRDLQLEVKQLQDNNQEPTAIFQVCSVSFTVFTPFSGNANVQISIDTI